MRLSLLFRVLAQKVFYPFPVFMLTPGGFYSPLDMAAERMSLASVEALFQESQLARAIGHAYARYLDDPEAGRALKKGYHVTYEERLRTLALRLDPPTAHGFDSVSLPTGSHPLGKYAQLDLANLGGGDQSFGVRRGLGNSVWHWLSAMGRGLLFLVRATILLVRYGVSHVEPKYCRVASPNFWPEDRWMLLKQAGEELGIWAPGALLFVMETGNNQELHIGQFPALDPGRLLVPRSEWIRHVILPGIRLLLEIFPTWVRALPDARIVELVAECFRQAYGSLSIWRVAFNLRFDWYLDNAEYFPTQNVKGIIFRKIGGRLVRWPHSQMDMPGSGLSYLGYDVFLSAGEYQTRTYGTSWYPNCRAISVGHMQNDRRVRAGQRVLPEYGSAITERLERGQSLAVFFSTSLVQGIQPLVLELLAMFWRLLANRDDWFLVVKPKGAHDLYKLMVNDSRFAGWEETPNVICLRYPTPGLEVCPAGWLIERMKFGVSLGGSVQVEALTQGKPLFAYRPVCQTTPYTQKLTECGLWHGNIESLEKALLQFIGNPNAYPIPYEWFREAFDLFGDDQALTRIATILLEDREQPLETV